MRCGKSPPKGGITTNTNRSLGGVGCCAVGVCGWGMCVARGTRGGVWELRELVRVVCARKNTEVH
jgi:hypothetical protein